MPDTGKAPFGVLVEGQLKPGATLKARELGGEAVTRLQDSGGPPHWAYDVVSGGSGTSFLAFAPFKSYGDLATRRTTGDAVQSAGVGTAGEGRPDRSLEADDLLTQLESLIQNVTRSNLEYVPALSNPPTEDGPVPGPYVYHVKVTLNAGTTLRARELAEKVANVQQTSADGLKYWLYATSVGERDTYHIFLPFKKYGDLDGWKTTGDILAASGDDANATLTELDGLIEATERSVLEYLPALSVPA
jgi:hypothetical protein